MLERATREWEISPRMVTFRSFTVPLRSRMVSASRNPCEGCSCVPSPALTTGISRCRATKSAAPEEEWRITKQSGFMAFRLLAVSSSVSPFFRLEASACRFMVSAPRREAAVPKLRRVRVALDFLEWLGLIENEIQFVRGERFKGEQITKTIGHIWTQMITRRTSERRGLLRPFLNLILRGPASRRKNFAAAR